MLRLGAMVFAFKGTFLRLGNSPFGKNHKTRNLILQFLLVVKNVVEQNKFFWCFIEDANMLYYYRKKYSNQDDNEFFGAKKC